MPIAISVAWSPDGQTLASGSSDTTAKLWQISDRQLLGEDCEPVCRVSIAHTDAIGVVAWHPDGHTLATGASDRIVKLWETTTGDCLKQLTGHQSWVRSIVWIQDGEILASGSADETDRSEISRLV